MPTVLPLAEMLGTPTPGRGGAAMAVLQLTVMEHCTAFPQDSHAPLQQHQRLPRMPTVLPLAEMLGTPTPGRGGAAMVVLQLIVMEHCTAFPQDRDAPLELSAHRIV